MERRRAIKFCVKLKKTVTETFEMLKSTYGEECLSRINVFEWYKRFKEAQKVRMQKSRLKTMLNALFDAKGIHHKFVPKKQTVNGKFYKDVMKRLIARVQRVKPEFQEGVSWCLLHDNAPAHSSGFVSEFLAKRGISVLTHPPYSSDLAPDDFLFHNLKIATKGTRFEAASSIQQM
jgi:histone-lysine N-methyltransferase SETMAR